MSPTFSHRGPNPSVLHGVQTIFEEQLQGRPGLIGLLVETQGLEGCVAFPVFQIRIPLRCRGSGGPDGQGGTLGDGRVDILLSVVTRQELELGLLLKERQDALQDRALRT